VRLRKHVVWVSVCNCALFLAVWFAASFRTYQGLDVPGFVTVLYWVTAVLGLVLTIGGFWVLTRGRREDFRRAIICILFATAPGCVGLVGILYALGTQPV
jgi:hypothetical protein